MHPVAYYSRGLNVHEIRYSVIEKEALAIVSAFEHFRPYLYGNRFTTVVKTDHKPLKWLFSVTNPASRLLRWRLRLEEYDYEVHYIPGRENQIADALSRDSRKLTHEDVENSKTDIRPVYPDYSENDVDPDVDDFRGDFDTSLIELNSDYDNFLRHSHENEIENNEVLELNANIDETKDPVVIFLPLDLKVDENDCIPLNIEDVKNKIPKDSSVGDVHKFCSGKYVVYAVLNKKYHYELETPENLFFIFKKLRSILLSNAELIVSTLKFSQHYSHLKWNMIKSLLKYVFLDSGIKVFLYTNNISESNTIEIPGILKEFHSDIISGHPGVTRTYKRIKQYYKWKNMRADIADFVRKCESCQMNKRAPPKSKAPMELTTTSTRPLERLSVDIVCPYPTTVSGKRFVITAQDDLTRFAFSFPVPNHEAETVANVLAKHIFTKFGIPEIILTDQGTEFMSKLMQKFTTLFKVKHNVCTTYHPETNGALERSHGLLHAYLRHYINENQTDWDQYIHFSMFAYNTSTNRNTGFSPYELLFGRTANIPSKFYNKANFIYGYDNFLNEMKVRIHENFRRARENLTKFSLTL